MLVISYKLIETLTSSPNAFCWRPARRGLDFYVNSVSTLVAATLLLLLLLLLLMCCDRGRRRRQHLLNTRRPFPFLSFSTRIVGTEKNCLHLRTWQCLLHPCPPAPAREREDIINRRGCHSPRDNAINRRLINISFAP